MKNSFAFYVVLLVIALFSIGCEKGQQGLSGKGTVLGIVKFKGKPVASATVQFVNAEGAKHEAKSDASGAFKIESIPAGPYNVGIIPANPKDLPSMYSNPSDSGIVTTVISGENKVDYQLK